MLLEGMLRPRWDGLAPFLCPRNKRSGWSLPETHCSRGSCLAILPQTIFRMNWMVLTLGPGERQLHLLPRPTSPHQRQKLWGVEEPVGERERRPPKGWLERHGAILHCLQKVWLSSTSLVPPWEVGSGGRPLSRWKAPPLARTESCPARGFAQPCMDS